MAKANDLKYLRIPVPSPRMTKKEIITLYKNVTGLVSRAALASTLGQTHGGARDHYDVFGWKKNLVYNDMFDMYDRNGLAGALVDSLADESWRNPPIMKDGGILGDDENSSQHTEFLSSWNRLADDLEIWPAMNEADIALGFSRYSVILLGVPGEFSDPLIDNKGNWANAGKIAYVQVFDEGQAPIATFDRNTNSPRYGMAETYTIKLEDGGQSINVHWSRVVHLKDGYGRSRIYGIPRLRRPYNLLSDLEKVVGSSSEAFWMLIRKGLILSAQEGTNFPVKGTPEYNDMVSEIDEWEHGLRRTMRVKGVTVDDLGGQVVDGRQQHDLLITDIAGTARMPQRVLVGSERGELASSSDDANWASVVEARQKKTCTRWVKDFAMRLVDLQIIPKPTGKISLEWPELFQLTTIEKANLAETESKTILSITGNVPEGYIDIADFLRKNFKYKVTVNEAVIEEKKGEALPVDQATEGTDAAAEYGLKSEQTQQSIPA